MNILAIETTGKYGSVTVMNDAGESFSSSSENEMNHLRDIISISDDALRQAGLSMKDMTHIAASIGPGSFTGIRIGVTTARTFGQMLGLPCVGVSSLRAMAERARLSDAAENCSYVAAIINARRHQTYAGVWETAGEEPAVVLSEKQYMIEDLLAELKAGMAESGGKVLFIGDGIDAYRDIIEETMEEGTFIFADESCRYQHSCTVAILARGYIEQGKAAGYEELLPEYMRLSEAEQRLRAGTLSDKISKLR